MDMIKKTQFVRELRDKDSVAAPFLVKFSAVAVGKNGKPYMNVVLMDKSGEVEARLWSDVERHANQIVRDALIWVDGKCQLFQGRRQVVIKELRALREDEVELNDFIAQSDVDAEELYLRLIALVDSMSDPFYKALAEAVLKEDDEIVEKLKRAPAAKSLHHAYRGGLLEHMLSVCELLDRVAQHYGPMVDRDLIFLGGFFHDICKIWELSYDKTTDYTDEGRLIGHLVMGIELVEDKIRVLESQNGRLPGAFPDEKKMLIKHVLLSHHGRLEYGSPKRPKCLEALIVHAIDDLDSKVNAIMKFTLQDQTPGKWTGLNRQFERYFYKTEWFREQNPEV